MTAPTNTKHQVIEHDGRPVAVIVPYAEYLVLMYPELNGPMTPQAVMTKRFIEGKSRIQAWREHLDLTQEEAARRMGIKQSSYNQLEKKTAKPRKATLENVAAAFGIDVRLLEE